MTRISLILLLSIFLLTGCNSRKIEGLVPAEGTVVFNGDPLAGATVSFTPKNFSAGDRIGTAMTNENGFFVLKTLGESGVLPNEYRVIVVKNELAPEKETTKKPQGKPPINRFLIGKVASVIPVRYSDPELSGIICAIEKNGDRNILISLNGL